MSALDQNAFAQVKNILAAGGPDDGTLNSALRLLAKWRSQKLSNTVLRREGPVVRSGPFAGMHYRAVTEGTLASRLLGAYEASLIPVVEEIIRGGYRRVINVGCAEGYFAVGLAMRMPHAEILAHDVDPNARERCQELAVRNGVDHRVTTDGPCDHAGFDSCDQAKTVVICDIEGAELDLLDPEKAPGLRSADILVECHDFMRGDISRTLYERFQPTHQVRRYYRTLRPETLPDWTESLSDMDRLLLLWEWRAGSTPWLWMTSQLRTPPPEVTP